MAQMMPTAAEKPLPESTTSPLSSGRTATGPEREGRTGAIPATTASTARHDARRRRRHRESSADDAGDVGTERDEMLRLRPRQAPVPMTSGERGEDVAGHADHEAGPYAEDDDGGAEQQHRGTRSPATGRGCRPTPPPPRRARPL
jgi:hypothetical protein